MPRDAASKDRRNIGEVVFLSEKMAAARELSSCCVGVEASLESDTGLLGYVRSLISDGGRSGQNHG